MKNKIHLIVGNDFFLIEEKINDIFRKYDEKTKKRKKESWSPINKDELNDLFTSLQQKNLFQEKYLVIKIHEKLKLNNEEKEKLFSILKLTEHFVFFCCANKLKKFNFVNELLNIAVFHNLTQLNKSKKTKFIQKKLLEANIVWEPGALIWMVKNLPNDLRIIDNEIDKITHYSELKKKKLSITMLKKIIQPYQNDNIFPFIEGILLNDKNLITRSFTNLKKENINVFHLLSTLETYLFYLIKLKHLQTLKKKRYEILKILGKNNFFVMTLEKIAKKTNLQKIEHIIGKIRLLEYKMRFGNFTEEFFLASLLK